MSFAHWLIVVSVFTSIFGSSAYIKDTLSGKSKPNRVSWGLWALAPLIGTAAAISAHADPWTTVRIFIAGFLPLLVFLVSFINPKSYWKLTKFDFLCGFFSIVALVVWGVTSNPILAILLAALADGFATIPTLGKLWTNPESETPIAYITGFIGVLLVIPSIPVWNIENSAFQIYLILANGLMLGIMFRKKLFPA